MILPTSFGSVESETRSILQDLESLLSEERNLNLSQHSSIIYLYVRDMKDFAAVNAVWSEIFENEPSSRACVQTSIPNGFRVALEYYHVLGNRESLHVQGISNWAPANIGPYSQAITIDRNVCFLAGMIGLTPATMQLPSSNLLPQLEKVIQNEISVLQVLGSSLDQVACATFYLVSQDHVSLVKNVWQNIVVS
jgi:diphthine-ammonia ligase